MKALAFLLTLFPFLTISQTDTLVVEVIYGSKPIDKSERHWFGGKLGGHIGLRIGEDSIMHFVPGGSVNATNINSDTGKYLISGTRSFYRTFYCDTTKTCRIFIPITSQQKQHLLQDAGPFLKEGPYPYAFSECAALLPAITCYLLQTLQKISPEAK